MIQVKVQSRPTTQQLIQNKFVQSKFLQYKDWMKKHGVWDDYDINTTQVKDELLKTIHFPKDFKSLSQSLPQRRYHPKSISARNANQLHNLSNHIENEVELPQILHSKQLGKVTSDTYDMVSNTINAKTRKSELDNLENDIDDMLALEN